MRISDLFKKAPGPKKTKELERILNLPQRNAEKLGAKIAETLSAELRTTHGTQTLRPLQALALAEAYDFDGAVVLLPVGGGKTLVSYLLPTIMEADNPLLLLPGKLVEKTKREFAELEKHWVKPINLQICSYEYVSTHAGILDGLAPDLIIADESHKLKNKKAGCTKRVWKYWYTNDNIKFVPMSGTLAKRSFFDWWHLQCMALPDMMGVLPYSYPEVELWAKAMDEKNPDRASLGALEVFGKTLNKAREGYGKFLKKVPGVIAADTQDIDASIYLTLSHIKNSRIDTAIQEMTATWELPDGTEIMEAAALWRHTREMANGFYYFWKEQPPEEWREARRLANGKIRQTLKGSRKFETPAQVFEALRDDPIIKAWKEIEKTFKPKTIAEFFDMEILHKAISKAKEHNALLWYEHKAAGRAISLHLPTYGSGGLNLKTGEHISNAKGAIAVSIGACSEGFNLQAWNHNILLQSPTTGDKWEQLLGRTHRFGQKADTVTAELLITCPTQEADFEQALLDAQYMQETTGQTQKLVLADIIRS